MSDFYFTDICTSDLCPFFKFSNLNPNKVTAHTDLHSEKDVDYSNKSAIDLRIWKGHQLENTFKSDHDLR